jgi:hypothetical protein
MEIGMGMCWQLQRNTCVAPRCLPCLMRADGELRGALLLPPPLLLQAGRAHGCECHAAPLCRRGAAQAAAG